MPLFVATTTVLAGNGTFTSTPVITDRFDHWGGSVFADQTGTCFIEQSGDWDPIALTGHWDVSNSHAVVASTGQQIYDQIVLPWIRVRYVNGATPQTAFRLILRGEATGLST